MMGIAALYTRTWVHRSSFALGPPSKPSEGSRSPTLPVVSSSRAAPCHCVIVVLRISAHPRTRSARAFRSAPRPAQTTVEP